MNSAPVPFRVVIPARFESTRLPGKPLLDLCGEPMIVRVFRQATASGALQVVVATDDPRIADTAAAAGADVCMTRADHESGTDRIAEVVAWYGWDDDAIVVNLQGDEPLMPPQLLADVAAALERHDDATIGTLATPLSELDQVFDPNVVKVVCAQSGEALYFSRAPIPWHRGSFDVGLAGLETLPRDMLRHLGLYAYRAGFLRRFVAAGVASIERLECLEQLRALWMGERIQVVVCERPPPPGIDTEQDLERVRALLSRRS